MKPKIGIGFRIGKLTVSEPTGERKNGYMVWNCTCNCGGAVQLDTRTLQRGTVQDCGCETKVKPGQKNLTGQRFGRLVCLEPSPRRDKQGGTQWLCQCDCGKQCLAATHQLLCGYKKSCGCLSHPPLKDYVGKRFGMLTVLEYAGKGAGCTAGAVYVTAAMKRLWDKLCCKAAGPKAAAVMEVHQWRI